MSHDARGMSMKSIVLWGAKYWLLVFCVVYGGWVILPFLAPIFMRLGWTGPADLIYSVYGAFCHQMAQRSFFLFGPQAMYNLDQLPVPITGDEVANLLALRAFVGNADLGWKVAWSDRMVYLYGSVWLSALVFAARPTKRHLLPLRWPLFLLLSLPVFVDGVTHMLSDMAGGIAGGVRYTNQWLADLTGNALPMWFYQGDAFGSFNSWMRLISGVLFGFAIVSLAFPLLARGTRQVLRLDELTRVTVRWKENQEAA
ncbi:MAG: DUF2085 domain-containing protein [Anaerolineae bacterium]|nr:DUF2085 domain-containing protein [Anaerolineae bacterium]